LNNINNILIISQNWLKYYFLIFILYSFIGWIVESGYRTVLEKGRFVNSGSLFGPFIPIYGFGATAILLIELYIGSFAFPVQIIIFSVVATGIEYLTSYILEKKFSMRFWDYSSYPMNINGRICLLYSGFWAALSAVQIIYIQPIVDHFIKNIPVKLQLIIPVVFLIYVSLDIFYSNRLYLRFTRFLLNIKELRTKKISGEIRTRLQNIHPLNEMRSFMRPLNVFPHLREEFSESMIHFPGLSTIPHLKELRKNIQNKIETLSFENNNTDMTDFKNICKDIIKHPEYQKLKDIKHHDKDIYTHNLKVAWISYLTAKRLKLHVSEMVRGALLHDFFFYDWRVKGAKDEFFPHGFTHPFVSRKNAEKVFGHLTPIEKDIIMKHMWPLTVIPPRYPESFLVSLIDKLVASKELVQDILYTNK